MVRVTFYEEDHYGKWQDIKTQWLGAVPRKTDLIRIKALGQTHTSTHRVKYIEYDSESASYNVYLQ